MSSNQFRPDDFSFGVDDVDRAIATVEDSRRTHIEWRDWLRTHPDYPTGDVGDVAHHERCIETYGHTLLILNAYRLEAEGAP